MADPLHESLVAAVERYSMWRHGATVLVAVSGGQDSLALLHALTQLRDRWGLRLLAAHYDHGIRGDNSSEDAKAVAALCREWSVPCSVGQGDVVSAAKRLHRSKQEVARNLRRRHLIQTAEETGASTIALGHTLDDRLETLLINIIRGTGIDGLGSIRPAAAPWVRPLIHAPRADTLEYCQRHAIPYRTDPSNLSLAYTRNRVREELVPTLAAYYNPGIRCALERLTELATEDAAFLQAETESRFARAAANNASREIVFSIDALMSEHPAMRRRLLRMAIARVRGSLEDVSFEAVETILESLSVSRANARFKFTLAHGDTRMEGDGKSIVVRSVDPPQSALPFRVALCSPGATRIEACGIEIVAQPAELEAVADTESNAAVMDADCVRGCLVVRSRQSGDRLQPIGMTGTRKLQDILTDRKVPRAERDRIPILVDDEGIVWVAGHVLSDRVKVRPETIRVLRIEVRSAKSPA